MLTGSRVVRHLKGLGQAIGWWCVSKHGDMP